MLIKENLHELRDADVHVIVHMVMIRYLIVISDLILSTGTGLTEIDASLTDT